MMRKLRLQKMPGGAQPGQNLRGIFWHPAQQAGRQWQQPVRPIARPNPADPSWRFDHTSAPAGGGTSLWSDAAPNALEG